MKPPDSNPSASKDHLLTIWVEATMPRALAYAVSLVRQRQEAEDLVHDCYVRLLARSHEYDLLRDGTKLLFRSITNASINWHQRRLPTVSLDALGADGAEHGSAAAESIPEQQAMRHELESAIGHALAELPVVQRAAIELRSLGHSMAEVANILELSNSNARVVLHRARQALASRLERFLIAEKGEER